MACDFKHVILYAKGWYKRTDLFADLKQILGERCGLDPEHMSDSDMWQLMVHALIKYAKSQEIEDVLLRMFSKSQWDENKENVIDFSFDRTSTLRRMIGLILGKLSMLSVRDEKGKVLLDLGEPDSKILPLKDSKTSSIPKH